MNSKILITILSFVISINIYTQNTNQNKDTILSIDSLKQAQKKLGLKIITENFVKSQLEFLASDWMEGREMGTKGAYLSSDYIKTQFVSYGLQPIGDAVHKKPNRYEKLLGAKEKHENNSFFQNFSVIKYKETTQKLAIAITENNLKKEINLNYKTDFFFKPTSVNQKFTTELVFVGYGLKYRQLVYNDFKNVEVRGKIILRIKGFPGHRDTTSTAYKAFRWADLKKLKQSKDKTAQELGVAGIIDIDPKNNTNLNWATNTPFRQNLPMYEGNTPLQWNYNTASYHLPKQYLENNPLKIHISNRLLYTLLKTNPIDIQEFEQKVAENLTIFSSKKIKNIKIHIATKVNSERIKVRNVLGMIAGENTNETIIVGAHYDHLGKYQGYIWNGADDNASGVVGVLAIAKACMATGIKPKRNILFATWTGEERGLMGSRFFLTKYPHKKITIALNYDMISRNGYGDEQGNKCSMIYTKSFPDIEKITKTHNEITKLNIHYAPMKQPIGGSDNGSFAEKNIPIFWFFIGNHKDYHRPSDAPEKANWDKMKRIIQLGFLNVWALANQ